MAEFLYIISCNLFQEEVEAAVRAEGWDDVNVIGFPARCGKPPLQWEELQHLLPDNCGKAMVLGVACLKNMAEPPANFPPMQLVSLKQCFELVAGEPLIEVLLNSGAYLATPAWLKNWESHFHALGFEAEQYGEFFNEFSKELVLLDTGIDPMARNHLSELESKVRIPVRRIPVGLNHLRLLLTKMVLEWRLVKAKNAEEACKREHARELADHIAAMDMLTSLAQAQHESQVISVIEDLFGMLFAPSELYYLRIENEIPIVYKTIPDDELFALQNLNQDYAWTEDKQGFLIRIQRGEEELGRVAACKLAFPEYRERYLNMALAITGVCGLAIENARNRLRLIEIEKMKSLGILVAGVAHEINTPLGVSMTTISTLQQKNQAITRQFAERSMTQSDLENYLKQTDESGMLIRSNLERIGRLTDVFRQVGTHSETQAKRRFNLKDCIDHVIKSLENELAERISIKLDCDAALEIEGTPDDWLSIFTNLINNSIKHGFKTSQRGIIEIRIVLSDQRLYIDYRDDGRGMPPEVLVKIFDPFFTTDMQHGMGLGMHLVYNLVTQRLNGRIVCQSQPNKGVLFRIEIPL